MVSLWDFIKLRELFLESFYYRLPAIIKDITLIRRKVGIGLQPASNLIYNIIVHLSSFTRLYLFIDLIQLPIQRLFKPSGTVLHLLL
jgi:hypothetical protein